MSHKAELFDKNTNAYMSLVEFIIGRVFAVGIHEVLICVNKIKQWNQKSMIKKALYLMKIKSQFSMTMFWMMNIPIRLC